jgi:hypothetical protein
MANDSFSPVPLGRAGTGSAFVLGDSLGALKWLQKTDALAATQRARTQAAAQKLKQSQEADIIKRVQFKALEGGAHFQQMLDSYTQDASKRMEQIAIDPGKSWSQKAMEIEQEKNKRDNLYAASRVADKHLAGEIQKYHTDSRYDAAATSQLLTNSLYKQGEDGSLQVGPNGKPEQYSPIDWDTRAAEAAVTKGNSHLVGSEVYGKFLDNIPENSITYSREPLAGGKGYRNVAKSKVFELTPEGDFRRDPATNRRVLRDSQETLAAFESDRLNKQWLDGQLQQHKQLLNQATEKMGRYEELTPQEAQAVEIEQSPAGPKMELFKKDILRYGYGREEHALLQKDARVSRASSASKAPKFTEEGGLEFTPEVVGGNGAGGTRGLLSLASSDPLFRVKADGTRQAYTAKTVHQKYNLLRNGQAGQLVTGNASPQELSYIKPQLHVTTADGRVVTPTDPTLEQRYQRGDRQPLLNWVRDQREKDPAVALKWHWLALPTKDKLTAESGAQTIFERLKKERDATRKAPGEAGYQGDEKLRSIAQQMASQQGASMLIPYTGSDKTAIDGATNFMMRHGRRSKNMQAQFEYFSRETAPRPAEQRVAPAKKSIGVDFGTASSAKPSVQPSKATPPFKRAGTKKTGISF